MFIIITGKVRIAKHLGIKDEYKTLVTLKEGQFFGEMSIINNEPRNATAFIEDESQILVIDSDTFIAMIRNNAEFSMKFLRIISDRLRSSNERLKELVKADKKIAFIENLLKLSKSKENQEDCIPIKREELNQALVKTAILNNDELEQYIDKMKNSSYIDISDNEIIIKNYNELFHLSKFLNL